jgi:DNA-binding IclR family transcriptional regulator
VRAVGVALRTPSGRAIGALSIAAVEHRMTERRTVQLIELLEQEAAAMTGLLTSL